MGIGDGVDPTILTSRDGSVVITGGGAVNLSTGSGAMIIPPGSATQAVIAAAIAAGSTSLAFQEGTYLFDSGVTLPTGIMLQGAGFGRTIFAPSATFAPAAGLADTPTNAMIQSSATIAGADTTTITVAALTDDLTITTAVALVAGSWYLLRSTNAQTGYPGVSYGASIIRGELVRVKSVLGLVATLYSPVEQIHGIGSGLRLATPVQDLVISGIDFNLVAGSGTIACGIYVVGCVNLTLDVSGAGCSRSLVDVLFCKTITGKIKNRGQNNSPLLCESSHRCTVVHDYDETTILDFAYPTLGIPRGVQYTAVSMHAEINGRIGHCVGLEFKGLVEGVFNCSLEHIDFTQRALRDTTLFLSGANVMGACAQNCSNPASAETEIPASVSGKLRLVDCRVPDPTGNDLQWGALFVDSIKHDIEIEIVNDGKDPSSATGKLHGICCYDTQALDSIRFSRIQTIGVQNALTLYGGGNRIDVGRWEHSPLAGGVSAPFFINWGQVAAAATFVHVEHLILDDAPSQFILDHPGTAAASINHDGFREMVFDHIDIQNMGRFDDVRPCLDVAGLADFAGQQGDVVETVPPRAVTLANATDTFTLAGHDYPDGTPVYLGGTTMPTGYTAGTILYVRDSNRATLNTTFRTSLTLGGALFAGFTTDGVALTVACSYRTTRTPTTVAAANKGARMNGVTFGAGVALPLRHYMTAFGANKLVRMGAVQVLEGNLIDATVAALTGTVNDASTDPIGTAQGKPLATAGKTAVT